MGACLSCRSSSSSFSSVSKTIRVVHLNGYIEEFEQPITVGQVTGKLSKHFICTPALLLSVTGSKCLKPHIHLQPGHIYFLLPYSTLHADVSPLELALVARKLTAKAKTNRPEVIRSPSLSRNGSSSFWSSPARSPNRFAPSPNRFAPSPVWNSPRTSPIREAAAETSETAFGGQRSIRARSWKPILDPIREKSFNRKK